MTLRRTIDARDALVDIHTEPRDHDLVLTSLKIIDLTNHNVSEILRTKHLPNQDRLCPKRAQHAYVPRLALYTITS